LITWEQIGHFSTANIFMEPPSDGEMTEGDSADEYEPTTTSWYQQVEWSVANFVLLHLSP